MTMCEHGSTHTHTQKQWVFHHGATTEPQIIRLVQTNKLFIYPSPDLLLSAEASLQIRSRRRLVKSVFWEIRFFFILIDVTCSRFHFKMTQATKFKQNVFIWLHSRLNKWWLSFIMFWGAFIPVYNIIFVPKGNKKNAMKAYKQFD